MRSASEKAAAVSAVRNDVKQMRLRAGVKKNFETKHSDVFAPPGCPSLSFNCGIRVQSFRLHLDPEQ
jgi:hypothetical protein